MDPTILTLENQAQLAKGTGDLGQTGIAVLANSGGLSEFYGPSNDENRQYLDGILVYFDTKLTSGAIEAVIQLAKRMARRFRNFVYFRTAAYHRAGQLNLDVPNC